MSSLHLLPLGSGKQSITLPPSLSWLPGTYLDSIPAALQDGMMDLVSLQGQPSARIHHMASHSCSGEHGFSTCCCIVPKSPVMEHASQGASVFVVMWQAMQQQHWALKLDCSHTQHVMKQGNPCHSHGILECILVLQGR